VEAQKMRGFILDKNIGFDGQPVVSIATVKTSNRKTGNLLQVWILKENENPLEALKTGNDVSICGDCKHRNSSCYVNVGQAPAQVWKSYKRGIYKDFSELTEKDKNSLIGRKIRFGAYGDPVLIRVKQIKALLAITKKSFTGYTHAWNNPVFQDYKAFFMASVDSKKEYLEALKKNWRTFRVRKESEALEKNEFACPASVEAGKRKTCLQCMACSGTRKGKGTPAIVAHGSSANKFSTIN
jgi:hypothetical protein